MRLASTEYKVCVLSQETAVHVVLEALCCGLCFTLLSAGSRAEKGSLQFSQCPLEAPKGSDAPQTPIA